MILPPSVVGRSSPRTANLHRRAGATTTGPRPDRRGLALAAAVVLAWLAVMALNRAFRRVEGDSMSPTLRHRDVVVVVPTRADERLRGQIVVIRDPREPARETVKRVAALPGDTLDGMTAPIPPGHVAVLGDNSAKSTDSRTYGPIPSDLLVGRVAARLWPSPRRTTPSAGPAN